MKIAIVGAGYVGLVAGTGFAENGHYVVCVDRNAKLIQSLKDGKIPIYEPGLEELFLRNTEDDRLHFTTDMEEALRDCLLVFICVNTPLGEDNRTDLSQVLTAVDQIADAITRVARGQSITVTETEERESFEGLNFILPAAFMFLLIMGIMGGGHGLMTSTIEEKSSRVVEVLLSAVSPIELMAGKLLGHMSASLLGMSIYLVVGLIVLSSFSLFGLIEPMLILYLFLFFFIAFFTLGSFMMAVGAAVNELRETQSLMMPVMIIMMLPWFLWMPISRDPNSTLSLVASFLPPVNTIGMMLRLSSTELPPAWQVWASIGVGILGVYAAIWFAARVFRIGLLLTGKPPDLRTLIRWIRMN